MHIDHRHDEIEFDLVVRGTGSYSIGNATYELAAGTLIWLAGGQQHRLVRSPKLEMWVVNLRPDLVAAAELAGIRVQPSRVLPGEELVDLDRLLSQVALDSDDPATYNAGLLYALRRALRASRDCPPARLKLMHPAVTRALMLLRASGAGLSLPRLAAESGIAPTHLSRLLVEHTNRSFVDWRNRIRLERFFEDYRPGGNLLQAALDAGFGSYARFHHVFQELVGCPPSAWVRRADTRVRLDESDSPSAPEPGLPAPASLSIRQRWSRLVPLAAPALGPYFAGDFLEQLMSAPPAARHRRDPEAVCPASLSPERVEALVGALRSQDAAGAQELERQIHSHDFSGLFAGVLRAYDADPQLLANATAAFLVLLWTAFSGAPDPSQEQAAAAVRQVRDLDWRRPARTRAQDEALHAALLCHFVVLYHALQAARASGAARVQSQLRAEAGDLAEALLGPAFRTVRLTSDGFRPEP
ncbi:AraC family transcriptional regulator [Xanthobacter sediminis]